VTFDLEKAVQEANRMIGCPACKGVRFRRCSSCGQEANSFHDHRVGRPPRQAYETRREWDEVNGESRQDVPDRRGQP
jgi:uncharacterized C2H2 Zn-finger protein